MAKTFWNKPLIKEWLDDIIKFPKTDVVKLHHCLPFNEVCLLKAIADCARSNCSPIVDCYASTILNKPHWVTPGWGISQPSYFGMFTIACWRAASTRVQEKFHFPSPHSICLSIRLGTKSGSILHICYNQDHPHLWPEHTCDTQYNEWNSALLDL